MTTETNEVLLPYRYYPDPTKGKPVFNGFIFIGEADTDPEIVANQKQVTAFQEDGGQVPIAQPIRTGAGGVPLLNGSPVQLTTEGEYSIKVLNSMETQVYYAPSLVAGLKPSFVVRTQFIPAVIDLTNRVINNTLFATNRTWISYYNEFTPTLDLGSLGSAPFEIENIPTNRFDLAEGNSTVDFGGLT